MVSSHPTAKYVGKENIELLLILGRSLDVEDNAKFGPASKKYYQKLARDFLRQNFLKIHTALCKNFYRELKELSESNKVKLCASIYDFLATLKIVDGEPLAIASALITNLTLENFCSLEINELLRKIGLGDDLNG